MLACSQTCSGWHKRTSEGLLDQLVHSSRRLEAAEHGENCFLVVCSGDQVVREGVERWVMEGGGCLTRVKLATYNLNLGHADVECLFTECVEHALQELGTTIQLLAVVGLAALALVYREVGLLALGAAVVGGSREALYESSWVN